jgi:hypothetical protein
MVEQMRRQIAEQDQTGDETRTADIHILAWPIYYECAAAVYVAVSRQRRLPVESSLFTHASCLMPILDFNGRLGLFMNSA